MLGQYLISFREVLEAALVTAIVLAYLARTGRAPFTRYVWQGVLLATGASFAVGAAVWFAYGTLSKSAQVLFEGVAALIAVVVLTSMILWMARKGRVLKGEIEARVAAAVTTGAAVGLIAIAFVLVFREGLETVLFLTPFLVADGFGTLAGGVLGAAAGVGLSYLIFKGGMKLDLKRFFYFTSILLVLLAAGLAGYGVHELIDYGELNGVQLGVWADPAYNLGLSSDSVFHHKGAVGSIFAVMFGYTVKAEWLRVAVHLAYLAVFGPLVFLVYRRPDLFDALVRRVRDLCGRLVPRRNPAKTPE